MRSFSQGSIARYFALGAIALLIVAWLCGTVSDALAGTDFGDITITPELQPTGNTFHGYAEYRIAVSNRSLDTAHQVTLILPKRFSALLGMQFENLPARSSLLPLPRSMSLCFSHLYH